MRANFYEALGRQSSKAAGNGVRPNEKVGSTITQKDLAGGVEDEAMDGEELEEERASTWRQQNSTRIRYARACWTNCTLVVRFVPDLIWE